MLVIAKFLAGGKRFNVVLFFYQFFNLDFDANKKLESKDGQAGV